MSKWLKTIKDTHPKPLSKSRNRLTSFLSGNHPGPDPVSRMIPEEQMEKKRTLNDSSNNLQECSRKAGRQKPEHIPTWPEMGKEN